MMVTGVSAILNKNLTLFIQSPEEEFEFLKSVIARILSVLSRMIRFFFERPRRNLSC